MRTSIALFLLVLITCFLTLFTSCGKGPEAPKEPEKPKHPWDWEPEDPELVQGKKVYSRDCSFCHNEGEEGAPRLGSVKQWTERSAKGMDTLIDNAINGFVGDDGEMPPRGDSPNLTDEEVAAAVKFMVNAPK